MSPPKGIGLIKNEKKQHLLHNHDHSRAIDECFTPLIFDGLVSLSGEPERKQLVWILRDATCPQSVVLLSVLPFSDQSASG